MTDRHVRRTGDDYVDALAALLPTGPAWPREADSVLMALTGGQAQIWGDVDGRAADLLERESDPRQTIELLPDWEAAFGLPDPCYTAPQSVAERQLALVMRMTMLGAQSRAFFIGVAAQIGYHITITEYRTFVVGMDSVGDARVYGDLPPDPMRNAWGVPIMNEVGDAPVADGELSEYPYYGLGPDTNRFYWTVHVDQAKLTWFRAASGQCGVDPHLRIGTADDLECLLNRLKPAHTEIIFDYSGLSNPGDPMAGTP
jgi:uncharacterized protein YmfQ (DUF2313 family)